MLFKTFNSEKYRIYRLAINFILILSYLITLNSCSSSETSKPVKLPIQRVLPEDFSNFIKIILRNGEVIDCRGTVISTGQAKDSGLIIIVSSIDTVKSAKDGQLKITKKELTRVPAKDILEVYIQKTEYSSGSLTVFLVVGIIVVLIIIIAIIVSGTNEESPEQSSSGATSCPYIYSSDGTGFVFDAEPLGGAICEGLSRSDYTNMEKLLPDGNSFRILMRNETDEKQFIDELKLTLVRKELGHRITPDAGESFYTYNNTTKPESVKDENGNDITTFFRDGDEVAWQTYMPCDTLFSTPSKRHELNFKFNKPEGAKKALLLVNAGTALWGTQMIRSMLEMRGNKLDEWYTNVNMNGSEMMKLYEFMFREELFLMKLHILEGDKYVERGIIPATGPLIIEDRVISIPLENVTDKTLEIRLNPPPGYWKIDLVNVVYEYEPVNKEDITELDAAFAQHNDSMQILEQLKRKDKVHYQMLNIGDKANIMFDVPEGFDKSKTEIFLRTTGYYEINIDKSQEEKTEHIKKVMSTPGEIINLTFDLYRKKVRELNDLVNLNMRY